MTLAAALADCRAQGLAEIKFERSVGLDEEVAFEDSREVEDWRGALAIIVDRDGAVIATVRASRGVHY